MDTTEIFNYILFNGPITIEEIIERTSWQHIQVSYSIDLLLKHGYIELTGLKEGKPVYNIPTVNIEGE